MLKDHLNKLEYFCSVVEEKSFLKASRSSYVSQPQLSKIVKQLEDALDCKLLVRSTTGIEPTAEGESLYKFARKTIDRAKEVQVQLRERVDYEGVVRIGTYDSISRYFFPGFLKYLKKVTPGVTVELSTGRSEQMIRELKKGVLDAAITVKSDYNYFGIESKGIYSDSFGLYRANRIPKAFENCMIVFQDALGGVEIKAKELGFKSVHRCDNLETVKSLAEQGVGVGVLPHRVAREAVMEGKLTKHHDESKYFESRKHDIIISHKKGKLNNATMLSLTEIERFLTIWSQS